MSVDRENRDDPQPARRDGIRCPACGGRELGVLYTRHRWRRVMRVRRCGQCGRRVITYEQIWAEPAPSVQGCTIRPADGAHGGETGDNRPPRRV